MIKKPDFKILGINAFFLVIILFIFEYLSFIIIKSSKDNFTRDFLINDTVVADWNIEFHPGVGIAHSLKDFKKNKNANSSISNNILFTQKTYGMGANNLKIITLGGSTTDPLGTHFSGLQGTWPDQLGEELHNPINRKITIYNAGIGGATSSQESIRLMTLINYLPANYVLSLNGINEIYFLTDSFQDENNFFASRTILGGLQAGYIIHQGKNYSNSIIPNIKKSINKFRLFLGKRSNTYFLISKLKRYNYSDTQKDENYDLDEEMKLRISKAAINWKINTTNMSKISEINNSKYFVFLQPTYGLNMRDEELKKLQTVSKFMGKDKIFPTTIANTVDINYLRKINFLYSELRKHCDKLDYCIDISNNKNLNTNSNLYSDARHLNKLGNKILAGKINNLLLNHHNKKDIKSY